MIKEFRSFPVHDLSYSFQINDAIINVANYIFPDIFTQSLLVEIRSNSTIYNNVIERFNFSIYLFYVHNTVGLSTYIISVIFYCRF